MTRRLIPLLLGMLLAAGGCMGGRQPNLADGALVEKWRVPSPLPSPAGRQWTFTDQAGGLVGEGRTLAALGLGPGSPRWSVDLPPRYAITPGSVVEGDSAILLRGTPASVLAVSPYDGHTLWEQAGDQVIAERGGSDPHAVVARCAADGCDLTGRDQQSGKVLWRRHVGERVTMTAGGAGLGGFYLLGTRTVALADTVDGRTRWSLPRPPGAHQEVLASLYRAIVYTPPAEPGCIASFRGIDAGRIIWTTTMRWHDAGAPGAPCTYRRARLMFMLDDPEIPVDGALLDLDAYHGTVGRTPLDPGEYLLAGGFGRLTWTPGVGYRSRDDSDAKPAAVPPPADGRPWAEGHVVTWLLDSGSDVVLYNRGGGIRWSHPASTPVLVHGQTLLVYLDGTTLVAIGPRDGKR